MSKLATIHTLPPKPPLIPTGVELVDGFTGGGSKPGEVNVLLGPIGVGMTLLGVQISVSTAHMQHQRAQSGEQSQGRMSVLVSCGDNLQSLQTRAIAFAARVPINRLRSVLSYEGLTPDEQQQLAAARRWLNPSLQLIDFSSGSDSYGGCKGTAEICAMLSQPHDKARVPLGVVVIDGADAAVQRYLAGKGRSTRENLRAEMSAYIERVRAEIAIPEECVVWVTQHLYPKITGNKAPTVVFHHSSVMWSKTFAETADNALTLGNKDIPTETCLLNCTKSDRGQVGTKICKINGAFSELLPGDDEFMIDKREKRIVLRH